MAAGLIAKQYQDEDAAREHLEKLLWPDGPVCPKCGLIGEAYKLNGKTTRKGLYKCAGCREPFTVTVGTIFEDSKIPLHKWLLAIHLMCSSKKGISAHQLMRNLEIGSYRTAWFMAHRIRWALGQEPIAEKLKGIFEVDEIWVGGKVRTGADQAGKNTRDNKTPVSTILQRDGSVRSYPKITGEQLRPILDEMVDKAESHIMTDAATKLKFSKYGWKHSAVNHSKKEYARHEDGLTITTNTVEGYFSIIRRGITGIYHQVGKQYLDQYLREFDFRYNVRKMNDEDRTALAMRKTSGKRLMLETAKGQIGVMRLGNIKENVGTITLVVIVLGFFFGIPAWSILHEWWLFSGTALNDPVINLAALAIIVIIASVVIWLAFGWIQWLRRARIKK